MALIDGGVDLLPGPAVQSQKFRAFFLLPGRSAGRDDAHLLPSIVAPPKFGAFPPPPGNHPDTATGQPPPRPSATLTTGLTSSQRPASHRNGGAHLLPGVAVFTFWVGDQGLCPSALARIHPKVFMARKRGGGFSPDNPRSISVSKGILNSVLDLLAYEVSVLGLTGAGIKTAHHRPARRER